MLATNDPESDGLLLFLQYANTHLTHAVASATFLLYDLATTLDEEVVYVWSSANGLPKYLYLISRYFGLLGQLVLATNLAPMFCFGYLVFCFGFMFILLFSVEMCLMLRLDALYGRSRRVRFVLGVAFAAELITTVVINCAALPFLHRTRVPFPVFFPVKGCILADYPTSYRLSWIPTLAFDTLLFALNAFKCISHGSLARTPLIYRLFCDGSTYFVISFFTMLVCATAQFFDASLAIIGVMWVPAVFSYSGCHLLLSIRKTATLRQRLPTAMISAIIPHTSSLSEPTIAGIEPSPDP